MADSTINVNNDTGSPDPYPIRTDDDGVAHHQYVKVEFGPSGTQTKVTSTVGLPVNPVQETAGVGVGAAADAEATGNGSVIGLLKRLRTLLAGGLPASLVGGRLDVNVGNTPAVTVSGTATVDQADTATADYDSGAGTVLQTMMGLALPGSGGPVAGGTSANPVRTDPTGTTTQPVSGTVTANAGTGPFPVSDNAGSLTVDAPVGTPVAARLSDGTAFLTTSGGRLAVDGSGVTQPVSGSVSLSAVTPGTGATNLGKAEDGIHATGDVGVMALAVRSDAGGAFAADGDYVPLSIDAAGALRVTGGGGGTEYTEDAVTPADPVGGATLLRRRDTPASEVSAAGDWVAANATPYGAQFVQIVSSSGAFIDTFGGSGGTAQADKSAFTEGTTQFTPVGGVFNETITADPTEDQAAAARITAKRAIHTNLRNASGTEIGTSGAPIRTDPTGTTTQPISGSVSVSGAVDTELTTADLDTGAGTDTRAVVGLVRAESGGGVLVGSGNPLPISGTVTANAGTGPFPVSDNAGSLTVDAPVGTPVATRLSDGTAFLTTTGGRLAVDPSGVTSPVSIAATVTVQDNASLVDNAAFTDGTSRVLMNGYIFDETAGTALTEDDAAVARIDSKRAQVAVIEDETTRGRRTTVTAANALKVDGSAVTQPVSGTVTANAGTGSFTVAQSTAANLKDEPAGAVAHDGLISGAVNPLVVGVRADTIADAAPGGEVSADDDVTQLRADRDGALFVQPYGPRQWSYHNQASTAQTDTSVKAAGGAGISHYITSIYVAAKGAVDITVEEGTTVFKWRYYAAASGDGASVTFPVPLKITANTAITYTTSAAIEHTIVVAGFTAPG